MMRALVYTGVESLEMRDVPRPVAGVGQSLVRIHASGLCGSDMHAYLGHDERRPAPLILGHEAAGVVEGSGRRVTINPLVTCGSCDACKRGRDNLCPDRMIISMPPREGAFAPYVAIADTNLVTVPEDVPLEKAALAEPLACGWHAVRLAEEAADRPLDQARCAVIGGGAIGVGAALALRAFGAVDITVIEPNDTRRAVLDGIDGFTAIGAGAFEGAAHVVIDAVGYAGTRADASAMANPGGVIAHIGLGDGDGGLDIRRMTLHEITFIGSYTYTMADFHDTAQAIFDGSLGALDWFEARPLSEGATAFSDLRADRVAAPKIIFIPDQEE